MGKMLYIEAKVVEDKPGILAKIVQILADNEANISALTSGIEGIIPTEVKLKTIRLLVHLAENNNERIEKLTQKLKKIKEINIITIRKAFTHDVFNLRYGLEPNPYLKNNINNINIEEVIAIWDGFIILFLFFSFFYSYFLYY